MGILGFIYIGLAIFGAGVTIVDLFGAFDHAATGHDSAHDGAHDSGHDGAHIVSHDSSDHDTASHDSIHDMSHDASHDAPHATDHHDDPYAPAHHGADSNNHGSLLGSGERGTRSIAIAISILRTGIYFSFGAGATGIVALLGGSGTLMSLVWACASGAFVAVIARAVRAFVRRDMDSSLADSDFIGLCGDVIIPIQNGGIGKVRVRRWGVERELYARAMDKSASFKTGDRVSIIESDGEEYKVVDEKEVV